ncbi:MAG: N-acyl homoserine lactonase family protein [Thermomicrobiales bacterium]|nr:N-acyl homoserine lactonase family protein [Thermomicrobiales bacterium]
MPSHTLYLLHLGQLGRERLNQVPGYVIRSAGGRTILVDTGNPAALIGAETAAPWWDLACQTRPEDDLPARLTELGLDVGDIDVLISTHFDFDHCGRHDLFAGSGITSLVQRSHLEAALDDRRFDAALWNIPGITYTLVDGDLELEPGLTLLATPGHVIGHQSLFVETADGPVILAIDAIATAEQMITPRFPSTTPDAEAALRSRDRLLALAEENGAYLLRGHDVAQWAELPHSPHPFARPDTGA